MHLLKEHCLWNKRHQNNINNKILSLPKHHYTILLIKFPPIICKNWQMINELYTFQLISKYQDREFKKIKILISSSLMIKIWLFHNERFVWLGFIRSSCKTKNIFKKICGGIVKSGNILRIWTIWSIIKRIEWINWIANFRLNMGSYLEKYKLACLCSSTKIFSQNWRKWKIWPRVCACTP